MRIRCWGARGSIAVSGREYIRHGGDTTCMEIRSAAGEIIVVDAGSGIRRLGNQLLAEGCQSCTMLFTHAHWDHILGFPFFKLVHQPGARITVHGCPMEQGNMQTLLAKTMAAPYFPVPFDMVQAQVTYLPGCYEDDGQEIAGLEVQAIPLSHPNLGLGFRFQEQGRSFVFLTDNELAHHHRGARLREEYVAFCRGADLLVHDAEYDDQEYERTKGWGHSTWRQALELAMEAGVGSFGLFHHNQDRTDDQVDAFVQNCRQVLDEAGSSMTCFAMAQDQVVEL